MTPRPVDALAGGADVKLRLPLAHTHRETIQHLPPRHGDKERITAQTARERTKQRLELKPPNHCEELLASLYGAEEEDPGQVPARGKRPVPGQQNPPLVERSPRQFVILRHLSTGSVESEHPKMRGQLPEMHVENEPGRSQRMRMNALRLSDVERLKDRIECDAVAGTDRSVQWSGPAVEENQIHFRGRDPQLRNQIGNDPLALPGKRHVTRTALRRKVFVQLRIAANLDLAHGRMRQRVRYSPDASRTKFLYGRAPHVSAFTAPCAIVIIETLAAISMSGAS